MTAILGGTLPPQPPADAAYAANDWKSEGTKGPKKVWIRIGSAEVAGMIIPLALVTGKARLSTAEVGTFPTLAATNKRKHKPCIRLTFQPKTPTLPTGS